MSIRFMNASEKNMNRYIIIHLDFEFNSLKMQIHFFANKKQRVLQIIKILLDVKFISLTFLDEALDFLSYYYQIILLDRSFLRNIFTLFHRIERSMCIYISQIMKKDLRWWLTFLSSWSTIIIIQSFRINYDIIINANNLKEIGEIYNSQIFSQYISSYHHSKHIDFKEIFAILHTFIL